MNDTDFLPTGFKLLVGMSMLFVMKSAESQIFVTRTSKTKYCHDIGSYFSASDKNWEAKINI
jgi:hypothetical protein